MVEPDTVEPTFFQYLSIKYKLADTFLLPSCLLTIANILGFRFL